MKSGFLRHVVMGLAILGTTPSLADYTNDLGTNLDDDLRLYCNRETAYSTGVSDARKGLARKEDFGQICTTTRATLNAAYNQGFNFGLTNQSGLIVNEPAPYHPEIQNQLPSSEVQPYTRVVQVPSYANPYTDRYGGGNGGAYSGPRYPGDESSVGDSQASRQAIYPSERNVPSGDLARPDPVQGLQSLMNIVPSARPKCIQTTTGQACGFNCVNSLNDVRCSATPDQYCRSNNNGDIACGYNCISTPKIVRCAAFLTDTCISDVNGFVFCGQNCRLQDGRGICDIERYAP